MSGTDDPTNDVKLDTMRVLFAPDSLGGLSAYEVGCCLAEAWADHDTVVIPMGESGAGWLQAVADLVGKDVALLPLDPDAPRHPDDAVVSLVVAGHDLTAVAVEAASTEPRRGIDWSASSAPLGAALRAALTDGPPPDTVVVDLAGLANHDAGAGFLQALGARADVDLTGGVAGLGSVGSVDIAPVRELLADTTVVGVVPNEDRNAHLLGLRGITSIAGREANVATEKMLAADAALEQFVGLVAPDAAAEAGAGACGGLGWAIRALGGSVVTGPEHLVQRCGLRTLAQQADLVVTGCNSFDFATRGGGVVAAVAELAEEAMRPCVVLAGDVLIGSREMRTMGVESAYPVFTSGADADQAAAVRAAAARIARSWSW